MSQEWKQREGEGAGGRERGLDEVVS